MRPLGNWHVLQHSLLRPLVEIPEENWNISLVSFFARLRPGICFQETPNVEPDPLP